MSELTVGYVYDGYPTRRNIIGVARECRYVPVADKYKYLQKAGHLLNKLLGTQLIDQHDWRHQFSHPRWLNKAQVLHLFNQVSYGSTPWVVTFETAVPRFRSVLNSHRGPAPFFAEVAHNARVANAIGALAAPACKQLIALSTCALNIEQALTQHFPRAHDVIANKTVVLHPPQAKLIDSVAQKESLHHRDIRFLFVGASFFRKGGMEVIETLQRLKREQHYPLQLTIVSNLLIDNYATQETAADQVRARDFIAANSDWITHHTRLDNRSVLQLMREADVGLLPTYADTYGYVVLEFQAAGCPVITTDVRAMPEINDEQKGWMIPVPKNILGEAIYATALDRERISSAIRAGLARCIAEIFANRNIITVKAQRALAYVAQNHDPLHVGEQLHAIYRRASRNSAAPVVET